MVWQRRFSYFAAVLKVEARMIFQNKLNLSSVWMSEAAKAFETAHLAATKVVTFEKAYLCEQAFSTLVNLKAKFRNRLDAEDYMQVAVTLKIPDLDGIISKLKQPHFSKPEAKMK